MLLSDLSLSPPSWLHPQHRVQGRSQPTESPMARVQYTESDAATASDSDEETFSSEENVDV